MSAWPADLPGRVLYEDNHLLAVNKRCGEMAQGDRTGDQPLPEALKAWIK
jgi:23S rRNA pseudouridine1911/1915/1917 synthase